MAADILSKRKSEFNSPTAQQITYLQWDFDRMVAATQEERTRFWENIEFYWGINYGQWDQKVVAALISENRDPITLNILAQKVNLLAGSLKANPYTVHYRPLNGEMTQLINDFREIYLSDKSIMKWDAADSINVKLALIMESTQQMVENKKIDPEGNIAFVTRAPGSTIYDPYWKSNNSRDCTKAYCVGFFTLEQISKIWDIPLKTLKAERNITRLIGTNYDQTKVTFGHDLASTYSDLYRIVELHETRVKKVERLVDYSKGYNGMPFPVLDPEKDRDYLIAWGKKNNASWEHVQPVPFTKEELWITAFSSELTPRMMLENKPSKIQCGGLDLFPLWADRINGQNRGVIDIGKDAQTLINKHETQKQHMINTAAGGGKLFNKEIFEGDVTLQREVEENYNNSSFRKTVALDNAKTPFVELKGSAYDAALFQNEQMLFDIIDLITPVPAAMSSRTEGSRESGVLYQSKVAIAEVGMRTIYDSIRQHLFDKSYAYLRQAQVTYRDTHRRFPRTTALGEAVENQWVELNKPAMSGGQQIVINDISAMPLCDVIIKEDQNGLMNRQIKQRSIVEILQMLPPELGLFRAWYGKMLSDTFELDDREREIGKKIGDMELALALKRSSSEMSNMEASKVQAEALIAQITASMGGGGGAGGAQQALPQQSTPASDIPQQPTGEEVEATYTEEPSGAPNLLEGGIT